MAWETPGAHGVEKGGIELVGGVGAAGQEGLHGVGCAGLERLVQKPKVDIRHVYEQVRSLKAAEVCIYPAPLTMSLIPALGLADRQAFDFLIYVNEAEL